MKFETRDLSGQRYQAYDTRYICDCGSKGKWTTAQHAQDTATAHRCHR